MNITLAPVAFGAALSTVVLTKLRNRLLLSRAKHRSLTGHARISRRLAQQVPFYEYDESAFFSSDDAPVEIAELRKQGLMRLSELYRARFPKSTELTVEAAEDISDLQFTGAYRVPFQYGRVLRKYIKSGSFLQSS